MALPDIDMYEIRQHRGSQADAFEELCCQLANDEPIDGRVSFDRKGRGGDAGVEAFATLDDGSEVGWQVKFYSNFDSMIGSLDKSLTTALAKHPAMNRFIACFPFDLSDSRKEDVKTALTKWQTWAEGRIATAKASGRHIAIERWDAHEIKKRLTEGNVRSAGRIAFWFDKEMLTTEWLTKAFQRVADSLRERYSPESHVDLPVRRTILATLRDPAAFDELQAHAARIQRKLTKVPEAGDGGAISAAEGAAAALLQAGSGRPEPFPLVSLMDLVKNATEQTLAWHNDLERAPDARDAPNPEIVAVSNLVAALGAADRALRSDHWNHLDTRALLVLGEAGAGKSHLLGDACSHQLELERPALMILGGKLPDAEPWGEILRDLDLPKHLQVKQFLGALNAAGEASGVRALIALDALNEKNGQSIWPTRLPGLLNDLRDFPWITVVLSCRSTYEEVVIPDSLDEMKLPRIEHDGFDEEDVARYLAKRGITVPESPRQLDELRNPLFMRLACDALEFEGEALMPESLVGISAAVDLFTSAVTKRVERTLGVAPMRRLTRKAISHLAGEMAETGRGEVGYARADALMRSIHNGSDIAHDLLFQLANEGVFAIEHDSRSVAGEDEIVRFAFERVGDHAIAADLLQRSGHNGVGGLCSDGTPLAAALSDTGSRILPGLLEALAVQLPERFGTELPDLAGLPPSWRNGAAFKKSLLTRRASAFGDRTWALVDSPGDPELRFETLIALSSEPEHHFNALFLDAELRSISMPERDASWTVHLAESSRADQLVEWAWNADQTRIMPDRARLAATQIAWFLTATRRPLRDRGTKALVALLADRPELALDLWDRFKSVDDGYVTERLTASLYGAALQGRWPSASLTEVAVKLHDDLFAHGSPPANALLRDHALGLIGYAGLHGEATTAIDPANLSPPFSSPWPIEHVSDETIATFTRSYGPGRVWEDEIVNSCIDGDFGRYVLDYAVQDWSPARIGTTTLPMADDLRKAWRSAFYASATKEMRAAYEAFLAAMGRESSDGASAEEDEGVGIAEAKTAFRTAIGSDAFEEWREQAEAWREEGMYQSFATPGPTGFNLAWARRWVVMRAHELGWSEELHGTFDRGVRGERNDHTLERIGKKYQWLALYELVARMEDNLARLPRDYDDRLRLRNLEPSLLVDRTSDDGWREFEVGAFWTGVAPTLQAKNPATAVAWLHSDEDILDGVDTIAVTSPDDGRRWLVLTGFELWHLSASRMRIESWRRVSCVVVAKADLCTAIDLMSQCHLTTDHDLPTAEGAGHRVHLGEFPWRTLDRHHEDRITDWRPSGSPAPRELKVTVWPVTARYLAESNDYDGSVSDTINLHLPARWIMNGLGLRLSDGKSILYTDGSDQVRFWDPSVSMAGRSVGLVDREALLAHLDREGLVAIWAVAGEKNAYGGSREDGFGGRFTFTRLYHSDGGEIRQCLRYETIDEPSEEQLAAFMANARETAGDDDENDDDD